MVCGDDQCGVGEDQCNCAQDCATGCAGCCGESMCHTGDTPDHCGTAGLTCASCADGKTCKEGQCKASLTWTDPATDLTWQHPPAGVTIGWAEAKTYCSDLGLAGYEDWRLPTIDEQRALIRGCPATEPSGSCNISEGGCTAWSCHSAGCDDGCPAFGGPANGCYLPDGLKGSCGMSWSSTGVADFGTSVWLVQFHIAKVAGVSGITDVRCVR